VATYEASLRLSEEIGDLGSAVACEISLGNAYKDLPSIRDLERAQRQYRSGLDRIGPQDRMLRAKCLGQLGLVALERFEEAQAANQPEEVLRHLDTALQYFEQALDLLPSNAVAELALTHNCLGTIWENRGELDRALTHYQKAIRYVEALGNQFRAAQIRFNVTKTLAAARRLGDAREYALAALSNLESYGDSAAELIQKIRRLLALIEQVLKTQGG
jgi:tetratricopeptide (TPR) repeat protein